MFASRSVRLSAVRRHTTLALLVAIVGGGIVPLAVPWLAAPAGAAPVNSLQRMSLASDGSQGASGADGSAISADGRYVTFFSADSLVPADTNGNEDVYLRDWVAGTTELVSVALGGAQSNDVSADSAVSSDGRYVAFESKATNLVSGDTNAVYDVFVRDRVAGTTERVSMATGGTQANGASQHPTISADGRYVAFYSSATNLVANDTNGTSDIFLRDRTAGTTERVSIDTGGGQRTEEAFDPTMSGDGRYVAFRSEVTYAGATILLRDRTAGTTERIDVDSTGVPANNGSYDPAISADGRYVAYYSLATNLVPGDTNAFSDVFVRDRTASTTERDSVAADGSQGNSHTYTPRISGDGRYVSFYSYATNLAGTDTNGTYDVYMHDRLAGGTERISTDAAGTQANGGSLWGGISADGRYIVFDSAASNLVAGDTNGHDDIFLKEHKPIQAPIGAAVGPEARRGGGSPSMLLTCPNPDVDPCDVSTGNFTDSTTDLSIPGRGMPLEFTRTYNSYPSPAAPADGPLGYGWSYNYGMTLGVVGSTVTITEENGLN